MRFGIRRVRSPQTFMSELRKTTSIDRCRKNVWMARHGVISRPSSGPRKVRRWSPSKREKNVGAMCKLSAGVSQTLVIGGRVAVIREYRWLDEVVIRAAQETLWPTGKQ